jgi:hypothetical protein
MIRFVSLVVSVLAALLAAAGVSCGRSDVIGSGPGIPRVGGQYVTMSDEELSDACEFSTPFHQAPWWVTQELDSAGDPWGYARIYIHDAAMDDGCREIGVRWHDGKWDYEGNGTRENAGCVYDWSVYGIVEFSDAGIAVAEQMLYAYKSGNCDGWTLPCEYRHVVRAVACDRCWPGCAATVTSGRATTLP